MGRDTSTSKVDIIFQLSSDQEDNIGVEDVEDQLIDVPRVTEVDKIEPRPKQGLKPVSKLSYDELGRPTDKTFPSVYRGMVVQTQEFSRTKRPSHTWWCHPLAQCVMCASSSRESRSRALIHV